MKLRTAGALVAGLLPLVVTTTGCDGTAGKQVGMVDVLNAGSLPAAIRKVEERVVDTEKRPSP